MLEISQPEMVLPWGVTNIEGAMPWTLLFCGDVAIENGH